LDGLPESGVGAAETGFGVFTGLKAVEPFKGDDTVVHGFDVGCAVGIGVSTELFYGLLWGHALSFEVSALELFDFVFYEVHRGAGGADAV